VSAEPAPLHGSPNPAARGFVVVYRDGTDPDAVTDALAAAHGFAPTHVYRHALLGFSAELSDDALGAVRRHPAVKYVEHDAPVRIT
jgi:hypothetical protein